MATKAELLESLTVNQLNELADEHGVALKNDSKAAIVKQLQNSNQVRVADIETFIDNQEAGMAKTEEESPPEEEYEEGEGTSLAERADDVPAEVAAVADATPGDDVEPPETPPEPTTPIEYREPEQAAAPPSLAPAVALAEEEGLEGVDKDETTGRIFRTTPGVMYSESAKDAASASSHDPEASHITATTWVRLGELEGDLAKYSGHEAAVINAPIQPCMDPDCTFSTVGPHTHQPEGTTFTVRTRDQDSAILVVTAEDFAEVSTIGRVGLPTAG